MFIMQNVNRQLLKYHNLKKKNVFIDLIVDIGCLIIDVFFLKPESGVLTRRSFTKTELMCLSQSA